MKIFRVLLIGSAVIACAPAVFAGFGSTETFLPAVGRVPGQNGAQFYTTVWATNLTGAPQMLTFQFLKQGQANSSPASFQDSLAPGETKVYANVVESKLGLNNAIGAARVTSTGEIFVSERIFNQAPGADLGNTEGLFFAGVPKSFSISAGQSASIQGINQGGAENFRYNFALVETGGGSPTVNVQVFDGSGSMLGQKTYALQPYEQLQPNVADVVPGIKTINARITATVTGGTGSALLAGAQLANISQDSSGFEMTFRDDLLGGGGGTAGVTSLNGLTGSLSLKAWDGISITPSGSQIAIAYTGGGGSGLTAVTHDASLSGSGTGASPLSIANGQVVRSVNGLHDNLTLAAGSNVTVTPSGSTLTIASTAPPLNLPFSGTSDSNLGFRIEMTGTGATWGIQAINDSSSAGAIGLFGAAGPIGGFTQEPGPVGVLGNATTIGVEGQSAGGKGVHGLSTSGDGVLGESSSSYGVYGRSGSSYGVYGWAGTGWGVYGTTNGGIAGTAGLGTAGSDGLYGESDSGSGLYATSSTGVAGYFAGNVVYTGSLTHSSDARFKRDIGPIEDALERTLMLRGVTFEWRRDEFPERHFARGRDIGFVAQEVESIFPELVSTERDGYRSVDYAALTPILVEAIKAQQRQIGELTRRLELLESAETERSH